MQRIRRVALVSQAYYGNGAAERLGQAIDRAKSLGAELAILPELPLHRWVAATNQPNDADAQPLHGAHLELLSQISKRTGVAIIGGTIVHSPASNKRHNTALAIDSTGQLQQAYRKIHLPEEEYYWETSHYAPGKEPPRAFELSGIRCGIQICSDANRPTTNQMLAAQQVELIALPRATPAESYEPWKTVMRANAITASSYYISVNRPPEDGAMIGGPSVAIAPSGEILCESVEEVTIVELDLGVFPKAHREYPGYLPFPTETYRSPIDG